MTTKAAGILFISAAGNALFLQRGPTAPDFPLVWDLPGGTQEGDETAEETAVREAREEIGFLPDGKRQYHTRTRPGSAPAGSEATPLPDVDFTTFIQRVNNEFVPELDGEHIGHSWAPLTAPPQPLHPGCEIALARVGMNELDVARAIAAGRLTSPQRYANMWLFAIRITGTDVAYRSKYDEHVYRNPADYLNEEFLARCNGLAVIWKHPPTAILNSKEFGDRIVGSIFLPYIDGDEVWGIAKIYDEGAARAMDEGNLSTSPSVYFEDLSVNTKLVTEDGRKVLIEGRPSLLDHVAIAELGVWDKGGDPAGIRSESREDSTMTAEEKAAADKAKKDAEEREREDKAKKDAADKERDDRAKKDSENIDKMLSFCDSMRTMCDGVMKRMDAFEAREKERDDAARKDGKRDDSKRDDAKRDDGSKKDDATPEELAAADKAKKDAEEKEKEEREKADKAKKDAEAKERDDKAKADSVELLRRIDAQAKQIEQMAMQIPAGLDAPDYAKFADVQARADDVMRSFDLARGAPPFLHGETIGAYRRRLARGLQPHCEKWKSVDLSGPAFADDQVFAPVEADIYEAARKAANDSTGVPAGQLRMRSRKLPSGHTVNEFFGDPSSWMDQFSGPVRQFAEGRLEAQKR